MIWDEGVLRALSGMGGHSKGGFSLAPHPHKVLWVQRGLLHWWLYKTKKEQREEEEEMGRLDRLAKQRDAKDSS